MQAIRDDSAAFGLGSLAGALIELLLIAIAVNLLNRVALNQVNSRFYSLKFLITILCKFSLSLSFSLPRLVAYANFFWRPYSDRTWLGLIPLRAIILPVK